jgi:Ca2+-binding RTX toxin-like protein
MTNVTSRSILVAMALALPQLASAACPNGATTNYINATVGDACVASGPTYTCDATGASSSNEINVVEDYEVDGTYEAWGTIDGVAFCHEQSVSGIDTIVIKGVAQYDDTLRFTDSSITYQLKPGSIGALTAQAYGYGANDIILGSFYAGTSPNYYEELYGGYGNDVMNGRAGDDLILGEGGNDTIIGGDGADDIDGGDDHDEIQGGAGDDAIDGGNHGDFISGNDGDDTITGGSGGDVICGNAHSTLGDYLDDGDATNEGATADKLWGGENSTDDVECNSTSTKVDPNSTQILFCSATTLSSAPSQCP